MEFGLTYSSVLYLTTGEFELSWKSFTLTSSENLGCVVFTLILAVLSASAAAGMRIALPLLVIGFFYSKELWSNVPVLRYVDPRIIATILISWSLFELFGSKKLLGQRVLQIIQLLLSPFVGGLVSITVARVANIEFSPLWLIGIIGGIFALLLTLVQVGWFFRLRGIPIWVVVIEDILCITLVFLAFTSPAKGGIIALLLLWLAIRSSKAWRDWYLDREKKSSKKS